MEAFFLIIHVLLAVALIGIVLIQRSSTDGFGLGSGSGAGFMSGRQAASLLTRSTAIIATLFILNSLWLGWIATHQKSISLTDQIEAAVNEKAAKKEKADEKVGKADEKSDAKVKEDKTEPKSDKSDAKKSAPKAEDKLKDAPAVPVAE